MKLSIYYLRVGSYLFTFLLFIHCASAQIQLSQIKLSYNKEGIPKLLKVTASEAKHNLLIVPLVETTDYQSDSISWQIVGTTKQDLEGIIRLVHSSTRDEKACWRCEFEQQIVMSCPMDTANQSYTSWQITYEGDTSILRQIPDRLTFLSDFVLFHVYAPFSINYAHGETLAMYIDEPLLAYNIVKTNLRKIDINSISSSTLPPLPVQIMAAFQIIIFRLNYLG